MANRLTTISEPGDGSDGTEIRIGLIALASFVAVAAVLIGAGYRFLYGDVGHYWRMSSNLESVFDPLFLPGYPAVLFVARNLTGGLLSPAAILLGISCASFVVGAVLFYRVLRMLRPADAFQGSLLFLWFPFVGVAAVVEPRADAMAFMLLLASLLALLHGRSWWFCLCGSMALLTHKALWPFVAALAVAALAKGILKWYHVVIVTLPLGVLLFAGALYHQTAMWMLSQHFQVVAAPHTQWPLLDGIVGSFAQGDLPDLSKAILATVLLCLSLFLAYRAARDGYLLMLGLLAPLAFWCVALNQYEIWAAIRFGKIIVLPLLVVPSFLLLWWQLIKSDRLIWMSLLLLFALSQFVFAWSICVRLPS